MQIEFTKPTKPIVKLTLVSIHKGYHRHTQFAYVPCDPVTGEVKLSRGEICKLFGVREDDCWCVG